MSRVILPPKNFLEFKGKHTIIAGKTGSGKTKLAQVYLSKMPFVVALDTKGNLEMPYNKPDEVSLITKLDEIHLCQTPKIIYRPRWEELNEGYYDAFYEWCYYRGNTFVWTDEIFSVCKNPLTYPPHLKAIMTRGRDLPQGSVTHWGLTQRPSGIPAVCISEATHYFIFQLSLKQDRQKIVDISGCEDFLINPPRYAFHYWNSNEDNPAVLGKLKLPSTDKTK